MSLFTVALGWFSSAGTQVVSGGCYAEGFVVSTGAAVPGSSCAWEADFSRLVRQRKRQGRKDLASWQLSAEHRASSLWRRVEYRYHFKVAEKKWG